MAERRQYAILEGGGYLERIDYMGSDERVIESARMSTGRGFDKWGPVPCFCTQSTHPGKVYARAEDKSAELITCHKCNGKLEHAGDEGLLRTLYTKGHTTPFEMCYVTYEVSAPIFVFREWMRHRTLSYNEFSARYSKLPDSYYVPNIERLKTGGQSKLNRQMSGGLVAETTAMEAESLLHEAYQTSRRYYDALLEKGISRELARLVMPVMQYSKMRVSGNLLNWIRFLRLRVHHTAQHEIREYAIHVEADLFELFPRTMALYAEERDARTEKERHDAEIADLLKRGYIV